jgi:hypothetical protein
MKAEINFKLEQLRKNDIDGLNLFAEYIANHLTVKYRNQGYV